MEKGLLNSLQEDILSIIGSSEIPLIDSTSYFSIPPQHLSFDFVLILPGIAGNCGDEPAKSISSRIAQEISGIDVVSFSGDRLNLKLTDSMHCNSFEKVILELDTLSAKDSFSVLIFPTGHSFRTKMETMIRHVYSHAFYLSLRGNEYDKIEMPTAVEGIERRLMSRIMYILGSSWDREPDKKMHALEALANDFREWFREIPVLSSEGYPAFRIGIANGCRNAVERILHGKID